MTAAPVATQPNALERYRQLKNQAATAKGVLTKAQKAQQSQSMWLLTDAQTEKLNVYRDGKLTNAQNEYVRILAALRDVLVERLNEGQAKIYTKRTIDTPSPATADMEEKWVLLLEEYRTVTDELHSLAPQLAVEAYTQSLKAAAPAKSNGARPPTK